jgi:hypothetical protein
MGHRRAAAFLCVLAFLLLGYSLQLSPDYERMPVNYYSTPPIKVKDTVVEAGECAPVRSVSATDSTVLCTNWAAFTHVPAGHQLMIHGLAGYSQDNAALSGTLERCNITLEIGPANDMGDAAHDTTRTLVIQVGNGSLPYLGGFGDHGMTAGNSLLDEGEWYRLRYVERVASCTQVYGGDFIVVGTLSKKP